MLRGTYRGARVIVLACLCLSGASGPALADGPVGPNPAHNFRIGQLPLTCNSAPTAAACVNAGVYWLDQARAQLHQGPYRLPANFASLSPDKQAFILSNLDRIQYGLAPITGLTKELDGFAEAGVRADADPVSSDPAFSYDTANWAGAYTNMVVAYEAWMYDDGPGSTNLDCTKANRSGCWGHRHDVLWKFGLAGPSAMGAAMGRDRSGQRGYAMLLGVGSTGYAPDYYYTWAQAVAAGAGTHNYVVHRPSKLQVSVRARGHSVRIYLSLPARARARCQLSPRFEGRWEPAPFYSCSGPWTTYPKLRDGRYRVRVKAEGLTVTKYVRVH